MSAPEERRAPQRGGAHAEAPVRAMFESGLEVSGAHKGGAHHGSRRLAAAPDRLPPWHPAQGRNAAPTPASGRHSLSRTRASSGRGIRGLETVQGLCRGWRRQTGRDAYGILRASIVISCARAGVCRVGRERCRDERDCRSARAGRNILILSWLFDIVQERFTALGCRDARSATERSCVACEPVRRQELARGPLSAALLPRPH